MPIRPAVARATATLSALTLVAGAGVSARAVVATQGWWYSGFVSETGQPGAPHRAGYTYGILGLGAALLLLAASLALRPSPAWAGPAAAGLLAVGGGLAGVSSLVSCTAGCPLPPYETPTPGDLVHAGSSVLALASCGVAMAALALGPPGAVRAVSRAWLVAVVPLFAVAGLSLVVLGRGYTTGSVEKVLVLVVVAWALVVSVLTATRPSVP